MCEFSIPKSGESWEEMTNIEPRNKMLYSNCQEFEMHLFPARMVTSGKKRHINTNLSAQLALGRPLVVPGLSPYFTQKRPDVHKIVLSIKLRSPPPPPEKVSSLRIFYRFVQFSLILGPFEGGEGQKSSISQRRRDDNKNTIFAWGGGGLGAERKIVQNAVFRGKRHDNKILKVQILLSSKFCCHCAGS